MILASCTSILLDSEIRPLSSELRQEILEQVRKMADQALRVMALSFRPLDEKISPEEVSSEGLTTEKFEEDMVLLDPIRKVL